MGISWSNHYKSTKFPLLCAEYVRIHSLHLYIYIKCIDRLTCNRERGISCCFSALSDMTWHDFSWKLSSIIQKQVVWGWVFLALHSNSNKMMGGYGNRRKWFKHANTLKMQVLKDILVIYANSYNIIGSTFLLTKRSITLFSYYILFINFTWSTVYILSSRTVK